MNITFPVLVTNLFLLEQSFWASSIRNFNCRGVHIGFGVRQMNLLQWPWSHPLQAATCGENIPLHSLSLANIGELCSIAPLEGKSDVSRAMADGDCNCPRCLGATCDPLMALRMREVHLGTSAVRPQTFGDWVMWIGWGQSSCSLASGLFPILPGHKPDQELKFLKALRGYFFSQAFWERKHWKHFGFCGVKSK